MRGARRPGFTLMEILIAVMLTGLVTSLALAPVIVTVQRVTAIQEDSEDALALSRTLAFIGRDLSGALRLAQTAVIVEDHEVLGGAEDDVLVVMSSSPARQHRAVGSMVYKIDRGGSFSEAIPGLYRWLFPGRLPGEVDTKGLRGEDGELILPGVTAFSVEVPKGSERAKEYKGPLPAGMFIALARGEEGEKVEKVEDVFVFP